MSKQAQSREKVDLCNGRDYPVRVVVDFVKPEGVIGMFRSLVAVVAVVAIFLIGCQGTQTQVVDPGFAEGKYEKIAVFPFMSALHSAEDPDGIGPATMNRFFIEALDLRQDYSFIAPNTVEYAIESANLQSAYAGFHDKYPKSQKPNAAFLSKLATQLNCDAFLVPVLDLWQKDEVDYREDGTPATYIGATVTILSRDGSKVLFRTTQEDYLEGARSETGSRSVTTTGSGGLRADRGAKIHRAPPFPDVATKVAELLVEAIPQR